MVSGLDFIPSHRIGATVKCGIENYRLGFNYYYLSLDDGQSWHSWLSTENEYFINTITGWRLYSTGKGQASQLQQTIDGGQTWTTIKTVAWQTAQFDFANERVGWAIVTNGDVTALVHTSDGGRSWVEIKSKVAAAP